MLAYVLVMQFVEILGFYDCWGGPESGRRETHLLSRAPLALFWPFFGEQFVVLFKVVDQDFHTSRVVSLLNWEGGLLFVIGKIYKWSYMILSLFFLHVLIWEVLLNLNF